MQNLFNKAIFWAALLSVLLLGCVSPVRANFNPIFARDHMNIFPLQAVAPQSVIDGQLDDWSSEAFVTLYPDPDLLETFAMRIAFAYDAQGLLLAARFTDLSPLINHNDPTVDPFRGWNGDALQFRAISDAKFSKPFPAAELNSGHIAHMTMWLFTDRNEPVFDVRYGMDFHGTQTYTDKDSGFVFSKGDKYWTMEGRIPWSRLGAAGMPQPGDSWFMTLQALFGNAEGTLQHNFFECISSPGFHYQRPDGWGQGYFVRADEVQERIAQQKAFAARRLAREMSDDPDAHTIAVRYTNPQAGFVSLAICNAQGQIIRTLLTKAKRDVGEQSELWNGLDDNGKPAPAGEYLLKALTHPGITGKVIASVHNSGQPAWVNADDTGGWGSDHSPPIDVVSGPDGESYLMWTFNEGGSFLIRVDATGRKSWGADISWGDFNGGATSLAYDTGADGKGVLYVAKDGLNAGKGYGGLFAFSAETGRRVNFLNGKGIMPISDWNAEMTAGTADTAPSWERMPAGRYSAADVGGNLLGLAVTADRLYAAYYYQNKVVAYDKTTFEAKETYPVPRPSQLEYDAARQRLYVVSGATVAYLNLAKDGALTPFLTEGIEYPFGLALDKDGNLFVSVRGLQMQVRAYTPAGKFLRAIGKTGGRAWEGKYDPKGMLMPSGISIDARGQLWVMEMDETPKRQSLWNARSGKLIKEFFGSAAYSPMMAPDPEMPEHVYIHNTRFIVDYKKGTVKPDATVYRAGLHGPSLAGPLAGYGFMGATFQVQRIGKTKYAFDGHGGVYAMAKDRFIPLLYMGGAQSAFPALESSKNEYPWNTAFTWRDANGDGLVQQTEVQKHSGMTLPNNIAQFGAAFFPGGGIIKGRRIFLPTGVDAQGIPVYPDPKVAEPIITSTGPMTAYSNWMDVWPSLSSDWKEYYAIASLPRGGAMDGAGMDGIYRFDREGNIRWRYGRTVVFFGLKAPLAKDGDLYGALRILGQVQLPKEQGGEIVGIGVYRGYYAFLTEDGLYVDRFGHENGRGPLPDYDTFFIENFSGYFFQHPKTKKIYLFGGTQEGRIIELQGWEKIRRINPGTVTVTADDVIAVEESLARRTDKEKLISITIAAATPVIDGAADDWPKPVTLDLGERQTAAVGLAYDATNLYALFNVPDESPWKNASKDWRFLFKGGDYVDIQLGVPNPIKDAPRTAQPGDVRVMIGPGENGAFTVVGMWTKVPAGMAQDPMLYKSPVAEENFERVALLTDVTVKLQPTEKGYLLEAAIPWAALGMAPPAKGAKLQGDFGVIFSDKAGAQAIRRVYLFNKDTGVVNDIPSEVRVVTPNWGEVIFE